MTIYNQFIDDLASGRPPDPDRVGEVCAELRKDLQRELGRRKLWTASPRLVGIAEHTWNADALAELAHDAYVHSFVRRLRGIENQRLAGADVRGLVLRNLRNFLTERQKESDPIGYLVFEQTCKAARQAIDAADVAILNAPPAETERGVVDGATLLGFGSGLAPVAGEEQLDEIVPRWGDDLFPDLVTAQTNAVREAVGKLACHIAELRAAGVEAFRLGDLVGALKRDLRRRCEAKVSEELGEPGKEDLDPESPPTVIVHPEDELAEEQRLALIVRCVTRRITRLEPGDLRESLWKIWPFVRSCAADEVGHPAWTEISRKLGISRKRLPQLYARLGEIVRQCREKLDRFAKAAHQKEIDRQDPDTRSDDFHGEPIAIGASARGR